VTDVLGVIPAAGFARRLGALPYSKEILPLGEAGEGRVATPCGLLLEAMARSGVRRALLVLRVGKWDIPAFFASGEESGVELAYRVVRETESAPQTLAAAAPFLEDRLVALGFPDILTHPPDAFAALLEHRERTGAEVALALFPSQRADKADMVEVAQDGRLQRLWIKAGRGDLTYTWGLAVWTPEFTRLLVEVVERQPLALGPELYVGDVLQEAVDRGLTVQTLPFPDGLCLDVGTPEDLQRAVALVAAGKIGRRM
jgi:glucose-1-phosphate thymidylyltransferase